MSDLARARGLLGDARRIVVLTGAGVSAESGVPTFRDHKGLWKTYRPEELATPEAFRRDPDTVWEWYRWRRGAVAECAPNPGHHALARFALGRGGVALVTQNVDGLHEEAAREAAGPDGDPAPALPLHLHGELMRDRCSRCGRRSAWDAEADAALAPELPRCPECQGLLRPDVIWFGEMLDPAVLTEAFRLARGADLCLVVGTSAVVHPAASVPLSTLEAGGALVEVNPEDTPLSGLAAATLRGPSGELLPALLD